jgi:hypothetical protein
MLFDLQQKAQQDLQFIRQAMERAEGVSSVSGLGGMLMGLTALLTAAVAIQESSLRAQLSIWITAAAFAVVIGALASWRKAAGEGLALHWDPLRRFLLCLVPVIAVAAMLTWRLWETPSIDVVPALWMMLYGAGVLAAGTYAVVAVRMLGACFIALGAVAIVCPVAWSNGLLAASFGGLHVLFGWWLYKRHGG